MELFQSVDKQIRFTLLLAPFQAMTRIELEAYVNNIVECYLDVKNPSNKTLNVTVTKVPDAKRQIIVNTDKLEISGQSSSTISIKWSPKETGCWRDVLQFTDSRRIKYDIAITTTAKTNKEKIQKKLSKKAILSKLPVLSVPTVNKQLCGDVSLSVPNKGSQSLCLNLSKQMRADEQTKHENSLNKENVLSKYEVKIYTTQEDRMKSRRYDYHESTSILSEQNSNVWNDGSVVSQAFLTWSKPQEIRRATYVKEKRHYNGTTTIYGRSEEVTEDVACIGDRSKSNFSMLINELKFTTTDVITVSPQPVKKESAEFTSSLNEETCDERNKTFAVGHRTYEIPTISVQETNSNILSPAPRPLECCELSFKDGVNNLIASSPIVQRSRIEISKTEHSGHLVDNVDYSGKVNHGYFSCTTIPEDIGTVKNAKDVYIEISPPKKYLSKACSPLFSTKAGRVTKEKNLHNGRNAKGLQLFVPVTAKKGTKKNASTVKINKSLCTLRQMKKAYPITPVTRESRPHTEEISIYEVFMPSPFTSSMTENPFLKNTASVSNEKWLLRQELVFTLWLNSVLSTPKDLRVNIDNAITDTIDKWQSRKDRDEGIDVNAPCAAILRTASTSCHTTKKLQVLRRDAYAMLHRAEMTGMKTRIDRCITEGMLYVRPDRDLHRDFGLQKDVLSVFLCYNPLWLRIGLEAVYNESIPLRNNNDLFGLSRFITERFFTNPQLTRTPGYHRADPSKKFLKALNQFMLKKFLLLVYFLDYAKQRKLITHDPCLFRKQAAWKTSREILLRFSRDLLAGVGDVTKILRVYDYVLTHRQTHIDEYEYEVTDIRQDLRDGVRLCRVVELITGVDGLTQQCRAPAISRLQKVHNVEVALSALRQIGGVLADDVEAKYVAYGDRMKTLSLLWQIVRKIQAPRFDRAARTIQKWWRSRMWQTRVRNYLHERRNYAAYVIQRAWRLQHCETKVSEERVSLLRAKEAAIRLQRWWRLARESVRVKNRRELEDKRRNAVLVLQRRWRAALLMRTHRERYRDMKNAATRIRSWWRSSRLAREKREWFLRCRRSALVIQRVWKMYQARQRRKRDACLLRIQTWWRATSCSRRYQLRRSSCVKIQRWWRERQRYRAQRRAVSLIESWYLCTKAGRTAREDYLRMKDAATRVQTWWRSVMIAREDHRRYQQLRQSIVIVQTYWRRRASARRDRRQFLVKRKACVCLQSYWRRMIQVRRCYERRRSCVIILQRRWRAALAGRIARREYEDIRASVIVVQSRWRAFVARRRFLRCRRAAIVIQSYYRMRLAMRRYDDVRRAVLTIQVYWRCKRKRIEAESLRRRHQEDLVLVVLNLQNECEGAPSDQPLGSAILPSDNYWHQTIDILRTCNNVGTLLTCLSSLDTITKFSPTVCVTLCQLNLVDEIYKTISQRNRSQPWMIVCQRACSILITLAKYPYTRKCIVKQEHALLLVKLLSDATKDKDVFLHCATLIWLLCHDEDYSKTMTMRSDISWLLRNIQQKVSTATTMAKLQKSKNLERLYSSYDSDRSSTLQFSNMNAAILAIIDRTNIY
ncbi:abnormal spindle-like microcephaly-associated protein homolog [Harpegnathos saltator]|uniref:Protein abnormal spindle n=1 Tax=Harpegnathos saltator TaxID=610380 RepID=E2BG18_HARSA|nr:abnormal spindle-like microcephaly-associated protein homolog [Harpegnathos saltator]XP_011138106.1 abnormal spindle-like microcephaly-associated protein homolog [Harpegnathos saltator]XP_025155287.1 abnormal spindle-like microcephaly-associated protein homolog [Harpegnathos saltator]XP_025155295.1 abnormal spindle-like microcephaly-associated protein homolog [Harpegnathos saltator]XP_025155301.1 abnormal spindle-like microcephaly-associated protein homolog [Harpegnathos saltator]XP_0251553